MCYMYFMILVMAFILNLIFLYCKGQMIYNSKVIHKIHVPDLKDALQVAGDACSFQKGSFQVCSVCVCVPPIGSDLVAL